MQTKLDKLLAAGWRKETIDDYYGKRVVFYKTIGVIRYTLDAACKEEFGDEQIS